MDFLEKNARHILHSLNTEVYVIDEDYKIVGYNKSFEDSIQRVSGEIVGQPCYQVKHGGDVPCWNIENITCPARDAFARNERVRTIHRHVVEGTFVIEEVVSTPVEDGRYVVEEFRDLSDLLGLVQGILPICSGCKKIRDGNGTWHTIEAYLHNRTGADFTHAICPECAERLYPNFIDQDSNQES